MKYIVAAFVLAVLNVHSERVEVVVKNRMPSTIVGSVKTLLESFVVDHDDMRSVLILNGAPEDMDSARRVIAMFDVKPMQVYIRFKLSNEVTKASCEGVATVANNDTFAFSTTEVSSRVEVRPRISEKGPINVRIRLHFDKAQFEVTNNANSAEQFIVEVPKMTPINGDAVEALKNKDSRLFPRLSISAAIVAPSKKKS